MNLTVEQLVDELKRCSEANLHKEALKVVNILSEKDPHNSEFILYKLQALEGLGRATENIALLQYYVNLRSTDITGYLLLYKAYLAKDDVACAIISLVYALSIEPNNEQCLNLLYNLIQSIDKNFTKVKINNIIIGRIGHLASEIEPLLRKIEEEKENDCLYLFLSNDDKACNTYLYSLLKSYSNIIEDSFWTQFYATRPMLLNDFFYAEFPYDMNSLSRGNSNENINSDGIPTLIKLYNMSDRCVHLPPTDIDFGYELLANKGITKDDKLVCFHVRDSAYLDERHPNHDFSYHSFRDADIQSYIPSIKYLIEQGYKVVRIGASTNQSISIDLPNYYDFCIDRDIKYGDFLEVFLIDQCDFMHASSSGPYGVAAMFDIPTLITNVSPYSSGYSKYGRYVPKQITQHGELLNFIDVSNGRTLSPDSDNTVWGTFSQKSFAENNIAHIENTPEELLEATIEFVELIQSKSDWSALSNAQQEHKETIPECFPYKQSQIAISDCYLAKHKRLFTKDY